MKIGQMKKKIIPILKRYGVEYAGVFGSVARGEDTPKSDVDIVVRVGRIPFGIWGFVGLRQDIERAHGKKVDVASTYGMHAHFASHVKRDAVTLYERP